MTVKDCTLFKDDDGKAYFIFDSYPTDRSRTRCIHIARLSDDYLKTVEVRKIPNAEDREAPAMIKKNLCNRKHKKIYISINPTRFFRWY